MSWQNIAGNNYTVVLTTDNSFTTLFSSGLATSNTTSYMGLDPNSVYYFVVKIATEPDAAYNGPASTTTHPSGNATLLNPFFPVAGHDFVDANWTNVPGNSYTAVLSSNASFIPITSSITTGTNFKSFFGLLSDTTYYFKVKIATEPDSNFSTTISTKTHNLTSLGNYALSFNGTGDQLVTLPAHASFDLLNNHTLEFWFRRNAVGAGFEHIISKDNGPMDRGWGIVIQNTGHIRYEPFGVGGGLTSNIAILDTNWHHFALTRNASMNTIMYIDGAQVGSAITNSPLVTGAPLKFGLRDNDQDDFNGVLDEVRFWDSIRSQSDIQVFKSTPLAGNETGLRAYWDFDDGSGQILADISPSALNGTLGLTASPEPRDPTWLIDVIPGFGAGTDTTPPTVRVTHPLDVSTQSVTTLTFLSGTAQDDKVLSNVRIQLKRLSDGFYWSYAGAGSWAPGLIWNNTNGLENWHVDGSVVFWATGTYQLIAEAEDPNFNIARDTVTFTVQTATETTPPTVGIQYPIQGSTYTASQLTLLSGTAADETALFQIGMRILRHVDNKEWDSLLLNWVIPSSGPIFNDAVGLQTWQYNVPSSAWVLDSTYSFVAGAQDAAGNITFATATFHLAVSTSASGDVVVPQVHVIHPATGTSHPSSALNPIFGTASDNVSLVEVAIKVKDLTTGNYFDGATFTSVPEHWIFLANPANWNFGGIPAGAWVDGRSYRITARAKDGNQNLGFHSADFTVNNGASNDTIPPTVTITSPLDGTVLSPNAVLIQGTAGDNVALSSVTVSLKRLDNLLFYDGLSFVSGAEVMLHANGLSFWDFPIPSVVFQNASYRLEVEGRDTSNNTIRTSINFTITGATSSSDVTAPTISISTPINNQTYTDALDLANIVGTAADNTSVIEVSISLRDDNNKYFNGATWTDTIENWGPVFGSLNNWVVPLPVSAWKNGIFLMRARARDSANNFAYTSSTFTVSGITGGGNGDPQPPFTFINNPPPSATMPPEALTNLDGHSEDPFGVDQVLVSLRNNQTSQYWNGASFGSTNEYWLNPSIFFSDSISKDWFLNVPVAAYTNGDYLLRVQAIDSNNNIGYVSSTFTVTGAGSGAGDFTPPLLEILNPADNASVTTDQLVNLSGTASDTGGIAKIDVQILRDSDGYYWNGGIWDSQETWLRAQGSTTWSLIMPIGMWASGDYQVSARAEDFAFNQTIEAHDVTVTGAGGSGTPPTAVIDFPVNGQTYSPASLAALSGTATDDSALVRTQIRITDINIAHDWDPVNLIWVPFDYWFDATLVANDWSTGLIPAWPSGHFRLSVQSEDDQGLLSLPATVEFFVDVSGNAGGDFTAPSAITNLAAQTGDDVGSVKLTWTATGDDQKTGTASHYTIKYLNSPIQNEQDWFAATDVRFAPLNQHVPPPQASGSAETLTVSNLTPGVPFFWAIRAFDEAGNRSQLSNSPIATAKNDCTAGVGDGEGTAALLPASIAESTLTQTTMTVTVGASGITAGGKVFIKVPDGWAFPQTHQSGFEGYVSHAVSNQSVTTSLTLNGPVMTVKVETGNLTQGDTITLYYLALPSCGVLSNVEFDVLTQAGSCGVPSVISSLPSLNVTAGAASWIGFNAFDKLVQLNTIETFKIQGQNHCGNVANVASNINVTVEAVTFNNGTGLWDPDSDADLSLASDLSSPFKSSVVTITNGTSERDLYYRLTSNANSGNNFVRITHTDIETGNFTSDNLLPIFPSAAGQAISNLSVDLGSTGNLTSVIMTPDGDGSNDIAFINFQLGDPNLSWQVEVSRDGFSTIDWQAYGFGSPARQAWDGHRSFPFNDIAPAGTYQVRISAGGQQDTSLQIVLQANGISGQVVSSTSSSPISNAFVDAFGPVNRHSQTDSSGNFSLSGLPDGAYTVRIEKFGFAPQEVAANVSGSILNLGTVQLQPVARLVFNGTRSDSNGEIWGSIRARSGTEERFATVHFADGRTTADDGFSSSAPELLVAPSVAYDISLNLPGYTLTPLNRTFTEGETFNWNVTLNAQNGISGQVQLANGIVNTAGVEVDLGAGLDANNDGQFDQGFPSFFTNTFIPPFETQANYSFPGLGDGTFLVGLRAEGFTPVLNTVVIAGSSQTLNLTLNQNGQLALTVNVTGDTTALGNSGTFPVTLRLGNASGFHATKTIQIATNTTSTAGVATFTGVPDGTYSVFHDRIQGFGITPAGPVSVTLSGGTGASTLNFIQRTGIVQGTLTLDGSSSMGNVAFQLISDNTTQTSPSLSGNGFTFNNLETGLYTLSILDTFTNASEIRQISVQDGQTTDLGTISLVGVNFYSVSGFVRTVAAPPYHSLTSIVSNSTPTTLYVVGGTQTVSHLRVEAYLVNPDRTIERLPTTAGSVLDPAKIRFGTVSTADGSYQITGLKEGQPYRVRLNTDFDSDGSPDFPIEDNALTLTANKTDLNFTIRDGAKIQGTITAPATDNGHPLVLKLTDTDLNEVIRTSSVSLVGTQASFNFPNLRVGRYLIQTVDGETPAKYAAKPEFVTLDTVSEIKTVGITLSRGAVVRGKLADESGQLITSNNASVVLPTNFRIRIISKGHVTEASGPTADGTFSADILPDVNYDVLIHPPANTSGQTSGKNFLPITLNVRANVGQFYDWGVQVLQSGTDVSGTVQDDQSNALSNVPVLAFQALARNLDPIVVLTDEQGRFTFEDLDPRIRFYDFVINPPGRVDSQSQYSQSRRAMVDITKSAEITGLDFTLSLLQGSVSGTILPAAGKSLVAAFGQNEGLGGASILIIDLDENKILEFLSNIDGTFTIPLAPGRYDVEVLAQGHLPHLTQDIDVANTANALGNLQLLSGIQLTGKLRNADGTLPSQEQITQLLAIDANNNIYRAHLFEEPTTLSVESYAFYGLNAGAHSITAVDQIGRLKVLKTSFDVPAQDTTLDLTFEAVGAQLTASFIQKLPDGVEIIFGSNQAFRNNPDDLNNNGTADDNEFDTFASVRTGAGSLAFDAVSPDRRKANYTYTLGNETGNILEVDASFNTQETNPTTGSNFVASGTFRHHFGLESQQEDLVTRLGGNFSLPGGSQLTIPSNWSPDSNLQGTLVRFQAADGVDDFENQSALATSGAGAIQLANKLGASAYPSHMFRAIQTLASASNVNPFSSFYDIFLPAGVSRVFTNTPTLTLKYDDTADPSQINIYYFNEAQGVYTIENTDRRVDTVNKTISVTIAHASIFTVLQSSVPIIQGTAYSGAFDVFNFPNPFDLNSKTVSLQSVSSNASRTINGTMIKISAPASISGAVEIQIFNMAGEKVRTLSTTIASGGSHNYLEWDGRNDSGEKVASGVYIGRLTVNGGTEKFFKMAVIK